MAKKIISLILSAFVILSCVPGALAFGSQDDEVNKNVKILEALGGLGEIGLDGFIPEDIITRGEFIEVLVNALELISEGTEITAFSDVPSNSPYYETVNIARVRGMISGDGQNNFYPDDLITYNDAVAILVNLLGAREFAASYGGYPGGYTKLAGEMGVLKGVEVEDPENILKSEAAKMIVNALNAKAYVLDIVGNDKVYYKNETLLYKHRKILLSDGVLEATQYTAVADAFDEARKNIVISGKEYGCAIDVEECLGRAVEFYYDENENEIVYLAAKNADDKTVIKAQNIIKVDGRKILYYEDSEQTKERRITLPQNLKVIYNHRAKIDYTMDDFDILSGEIVIASSPDGDNDIAYITEFRSIMVDTIDSENKVVTDKYNAQYNVSLDEKELDRLVIYNYTDGKAASFEDIQKDDVLSIAESADGAIIDAYIVRDTMEGNIERIVERMPVYTVGTLIGEYKVAPKKELTAMMMVGSYGRFYFDVCGVAAGFELISDSASRYVFSISIKNVEDDFGEKCIKMKYLDMDGKIRTILWKSEYVRIDKEKLETFIEEPEFFSNPQVIILKSGKKWLDIDTYERTSGEGHDTLNKLLDIKSSVSYMSADFNLGGRAIIDTDTKVIKVPRKTVSTPTGNVTVIDADNEAGFVVSDYKALVNTQKYAFTAYNADYNSYTPDIILIYEGASLNTGSPIVLVTKVNTALDEDDEAVCVVKGYNQKDEIELTDGDLKLLENLNLMPGDVVKYKLNNENKVCAAAKVFDSRTLTLSTTGFPYYPDDYGNSFQVRSNYAYKIEGTNLYLSDSTLASEKLSKMEVVPCKSALAYRVYKSGKIEPTTLNQINTFKNHANPEYVFAQLTYGVGKMVVVYEG